MKVLITIVVVLAIVGVVVWLLCRRDSDHVTVTDTGEFLVDHEVVEADDESGFADLEIPEPSRIAVIPRAVAAVAPATGAAPTRFVLEARLLDGSGRVLPPSTPDGLQWDVRAPDPSWISIEGLGRHQSMVSINPSAPDNQSWQATVSVRLGEMSSDPGRNGTIRVLPAGLQGVNDDRVIGGHVDRRAPSAALLDGARDQSGVTTCVNDQLVMFVIAGLLGNVVNQACADGNRVAVFSPDSRMVLHDSRTGDWSSSAGDEVDVTGEQGSPRAVTLAVWVAVDPERLRAGETPADVFGGAAQDVLDAIAILADNRTGITVVIQPVGDSEGLPIEISQLDAVSRIGTSCKALDEYSQALPEYLASGTTLNVFYVTGGPARGMYCAPVPLGRAEGAVYVNWFSSAHATLAHEIAHSLGLVVPYAGHTDRLAGFTGVNLMAPVDPSNPVPRGHLTLGQAFKMNADAFSWIQRVAAPAGTMDCQCDPYARAPCPGLAEDVVPPDGEPAQLPLGMCHDKVGLGAGTADLDAVALVSGRSFRAAPGTCADDLPAEAREYPGLNRLAVFFPNVGEPLSCRFEVALFFRGGQRPLLIRPPADRFNYLINWAGTSFTPAPSVGVPVSVWLEGVTGDWDLGPEQGHVKTVYESGGNRAGLTLSWTTSGTVTNPQLETLSDGECDPADLPASAGGVNVYYALTPLPFVSNSDGGYWCLRASDWTAFIVLPTTRAPSSLAHHLGHVLSLGDVTAAEGFASDNVMWPVATGGARSRLALGQVFRLHFGAGSWILSLTGEPGRHCPAECPPLSATR